MQWHKTSIDVQTNGKGLYPISHDVNEVIKQLGIIDGMCTLFIQHTSASMVISESYDPTAKLDIEVFMDRLVPELQPWHRHTLEGQDDSPSHLRSILTQSSLTIPIDNSHLNLGMWQGVYVFEHRKRGHRRIIQVRCLQNS